MRQNDNRPMIGAIRWDAWVGVNLPKIVAKSLGPPSHRFRLPWYATVDEAGQVNIKGDAPGIMEQEIDYAANAGIDYWAFCGYGTHDEPTIALNQFLASPTRERMKFCMILHACIGGNESDWPGECARQVAFLQEPNYFRIPDGRPLVYLYRVDSPDDRIAARVSDFRAAARKAGLPDPYMAFMGWEPVYDWNRARPLGFDCVSAYGFGYMTHTEPPGAPFAGHVELTERDQWGVFAKEKIPCIPLIHTGWDKRPRMDNPVPWELKDSYHKDFRYIETARPEEIAAHAGRCVEWIKAHRDITPANAAICYAWNENDEGGWLIPTRNQDGTRNTSRVDALRNVLRSPV